MKRFLHFARLSRADQKTALQAVAALALCQVRLRIQDVEHLRAWATQIGCGEASVPRLVSAVARASRILPGTTCLVRAIALQHLLSINGHQSELRIGVGKANDRFAAHAWLVHGGRILIGDGAEADSYKVLAAWANFSQNKTAREASPSR
jgi:Transglutaminase-like superfamily